MKHWDQRKTFTDVKAAAERNGFRIRAWVGLEVTIHDDALDRPVAHTRFTASGVMRWATGWPASWSPTDLQTISFPPLDMPRSLVSSIDVRENLIAWLDAGRPSEWTWVDSFVEAYRKAMAGKDVNR